MFAMNDPWSATLVSPDAGNRPADRDGSPGEIGEIS